MALYSCLEHKTNSHRIQFHLNPHKEIWTIEANLLLMENRSLPFPLTVFVTLCVIFSSHLSLSLCLSLGCFVNIVVTVTAILLY